MRNFNSHEAATEDLLPRLEQRARELRILPQEFECPDYMECQASRDPRELPPLKRGKSCTMTYIGRQYGHPISGSAFRLVIAGMDHGGVKLPDQPDYVDFTARRTEIESAYYVGKTKFNPHYRGVIRTAAAMMGRAGNHCLEECWSNRICAGDARGTEEPCALLSFAQPNLVKCAASEKMMACKATPEMFRNCSKNLIHELAVLRPGILVFHGSSARQTFSTAVRDQGGSLKPVEGGPDHRQMAVIFQLSFDGFQCCVLFLSHPSHGWLDRQWKSVAEPALKWLRAGRHIPQ
jgi:Uracil DNA glycosylase superfamily